MRKLANTIAARPTGFTLIELVIVIVIIGILAAVAIPNLTGTKDEATAAARTAILGAVKSAWGSAYAVHKTAPTGTQVAAQMLDPTCDGTTCGDAKITLGAGIIAKPSDITCSNCTAVTINN